MLQQEGIPEFSACDDSPEYDVNRFRLTARRKKRPAPAPPAPTNSDPVQNNGVTRDVAENHTKDCLRRKSTSTGQRLSRSTTKRRAPNPPGGPYMLKSQNDSRQSSAQNSHVPISRCEETAAELQSLSRSATREKESKASNELDELAEKLNVQCFNTVRRRLTALQRLSFGQESIEVADDFQWINPRSFVYRANSENHSIMKRTKSKTLMSKVRRIFSRDPSQKTIEKKASVRKTSSVLPNISDLDKEARNVLRARRKESSYNQYEFDGSCNTEFSKTATMPSNVSLPIQMEVRPTINTVKATSERETIEKELPANNQNRNSLTACSTTRAEFNKEYPSDRNPFSSTGTLNSSDSDNPADVEQTNVNHKTCIDDRISENPPEGSFVKLEDNYPIDMNPFECDDENEKRRASIASARSMELRHKSDVPVDHRDLICQNDPDQIVGSDAILENENGALRKSSVTGATRKATTVTPCIATIRQARISYFSRQIAKDIDEKCQNVTNNNVARVDSSAAVDPICVDQLANTVPPGHSPNGVMTSYDERSKGKGVLNGTTERAVDDETQPVLNNRSEQTSCARVLELPDDSSTGNKEHPSSEVITHTQDSTAHKLIVQDFAVYRKVCLSREDKMQIQTLSSRQKRQAVFPNVCSSARNGQAVQLFLAMLKKVDDRSTSDHSALGRIATIQPNVDHKSNIAMVNLWVEDESNRVGPLKLMVDLSLTLEQLKLQVEIDYDLPVALQHWSLRQRPYVDLHAANSSLQQLGVHRHDELLMAIQLPATDEQVNQLRTQSHSATPAVRESPRSVGATNEKPAFTGHSSRKSSVDEFVDACDRAEISALCESETETKSPNVRSYSGPRCGSHIEAQSRPTSDTTPPPLPPKVGGLSKSFVRPDSLCTVDLITVQPQQVREKLLPLRDSLAIGRPVQQESLSLSSYPLSATTYKHFLEFGAAKKVNESSKIIPCENNDEFNNSSENTRQSQVLTFLQDYDGKESMGIGSSRSRCQRDINDTNFITGQDENITFGSLSLHDSQSDFNDQIINGSIVENVNKKKTDCCVNEKCWADRTVKNIEQTSTSSVNNKVAMSPSKFPGSDHMHRKLELHQRDLDYMTELNYTRNIHQERKRLSKGSRYKQEQWFENIYGELKFNSSPMSASDYVFHWHRMHFGDKSIKLQAPESNTCASPLSGTEHDTIKASAQSSANRDDEAAMHCSVTVREVDFFDEVFKSKVMRSGVEDMVNRLISTSTDNETDSTSNHLMPGESQINCLSPDEKTNDTKPDVNTISNEDIDNIMADPSEKEKTHFYANKDRISSLEKVSIEFEETEKSPQASLNEQKAEILQAVSAVASHEKLAGNSHSHRNSITPEPTEDANRQNSANENSNKTVGRIDETILIEENNFLSKTDHSRISALLQLSDEERATFEKDGASVPDLNAVSFVEIDVSNSADDPQNDKSKKSSWKTSKTTKPLKVSCLTSRETNRKSLEVAGVFVGSVREKIELFSGRKPLPPYQKQELSSSALQSTASSSKIARPTATSAESAMNVHVQALKQSLVLNPDGFECAICLMTIGVGEGAVLKECLHVFCRSCLASAVEHSVSAQVACPFTSVQYTCSAYLQEAEIRALVTPAVYRMYTARCLSQVRSSASDSFHCRSRGCSGWCFRDRDARVFHCPLCDQLNCLQCGAIHDGFTCEQYEKAAAQEEILDENTRKTHLLLQEMIARGDALPCPVCRAVLLKKWGCDWLRCAMCRQEICWVTGQRRWGPAGHGDISAGCRCGVNGKKCHPNCTYCH